jgi:magnesium-transporting ATPase (P-type)
MLGAFGMFAWATSSGHSIEAARTLVVNTIVVMEIFYLFSVRYLQSPSLTLQGLVGTRAVLIGIGAVALAQLAFTYLPFMNRAFATEPFGILEGAVVIGLGVGLFAVLELEKAIRRRWLGAAAA